MRVLITGMSGFAGSHLTDLLLKETHWRLIGMSRTTAGDRIHPRVFWWQIDLQDANAVKRFLKFERPDLIVHLAAQAHVAQSWKEPWPTYEANIHGTLNLFEGIIANGLLPRILVVSSNEVYGPPATRDALPFTESSPMRPANPYAVSKCAAELMAMQYQRSHGFDVVVARPFNHIGPRQNERFVASDFAKQIAEIEAGKREPVMRLGNMSAERDFTDVRDVARAYLALIKFGDGGQIFNVCSGKPRSIQSLLDVMLSMSTARIDVQTDPSKFRVADTPVSFGDASRIEQVAGWQPQIPFEQTVADILDEWRERVKHS